MSPINVHGLSKRFGDVLAVDGLDFEVEEGTVVGFLGPNSTGKTTTLRMLLGLVTPTAGTATFGGRAYREGIHWLRRLIRRQADQGRTVLVSSHVLAEVAQTVDQVVIIARGRLVTQAMLADLTAGAEAAVRVRTPQPEALRERLAAGGAAVRLDGPDQLVVTGVTSEQVGRAAAAAGIVLHEMRFERSNLEEVFLELTNHGGNRS
jgi:ABC-type multidrug transport system ATPase subunit